MTTNTQFEIFWNHLTSIAVLGEDVKPEFYKCLSASGYTSQPVAATSTAHSQTGYQLFVKTMSKQLHDDISDGTLRQKTIVANWNSLSKEDKKTWNDKCTSHAGVANTSTKQISGWNLFMKVKALELKSSIPSGTERIKTVCTQWKQLSKDEQGVWNQRAKGQVPTLPMATGRVLIHKASMPVPVARPVSPKVIEPISAPNAEEPASVPMEEPASPKVEPVSPKIEEPAPAPKVEPVSSKIEETLSAPVAEPVSPKGEEPISAPSVVPPTKKTVNMTITRANGRASARKVPAKKV